MERAESPGTRSWLEAYPAYQLFDVSHRPVAGRGSPRRERTPRATSRDVQRSHDRLPRPALDTPTSVRGSQLCDAQSARVCALRSCV